MLDSILSHMRGSYIFDFLRNNNPQEYTAKEIAENISIASTPQQVASAIRYMYIFEKLHININRSQYPFKYSYNP